MRYLDWDVLLFPADDAKQVPLKEFKTTCYAEQYGNAPHVTPLLTTFIPSLPKGQPFQISLHSWSETGPVFTPSSVKADATAPKELWQVSVVIDGVYACTENFVIDSTWPQIISSTMSATTGQVTGPLQFPLFHHAIMSQDYWNPNDLMGRIRVELSSGYVDPKNERRFVKTVELVNFAFQPAPMDLLEWSGIAWPNERLLANPLQFRNPAVHRNAATPKRDTASSNANFPVPLLSAIPVQPAKSSFNPYGHGANSNYDASSRSTSVYSNMTDSAAPLLQKMPHVPAYPGSLPDNTCKHQQVAFRLPSSQFHVIMNAIPAPNQTRAGTNVSAEMPPPPPPFSIPLPFPLPGMPIKGRAPIMGRIVGNVLDSTDKRSESRESDVSMHPACNAFPACTSEDEEGRVVHATPTAPATVVRGREEGPSSTKPRDFFSIILDTTVQAPVPTSVPMASPSKNTGLLSLSPADSQGKKRSRSALRSLNLNDGSPAKKEIVHPPRKVSKVSIASNKCDKENVSEPSDGEGGMMLDD